MRIQQVSYWYCIEILQMPNHKQIRYLHSTPPFWRKYAYYFVSEFAIRQTLEQAGPCPQPEEEKHETTMMPTETLHEDL